jgi:hypothetical protein
MIRSIHDRRKRRNDGSPYYRLIYCPLNSWPKHSSFTRNEILEMLPCEYLAVGTIFATEEETVTVVFGVGGSLKLEEVTA